MSSLLGVVYLLTLMGWLVCWKMVCWKVRAGWTWRDLFCQVLYWYSYLREGEEGWNFLALPGVLEFLSLQMFHFAVDLRSKEGSFWFLCWEL